MRRIFILAIFLVFLHSETIIEMNMQNYGIFRISDLLQSSGFQNYSTDGFFNYYSYHGLNDYQHQNYSIFINGHELFFDFIGVKNLNSLPINLNSLDSIKISITPHFFQGNIINDGAIHFYSSGTSEKLSIKNNLSYGNESNDAGPFRYTKYMTPNVDKIGSEFNSTLTYKNFQSNFHYRQHIFSDWATRTRISNLSKEKQYPMMLEYGLSAQNQGHILDNNYSVFASSVYAENMYYFFPLAGYEIPIDYFNNHLGIILNRKMTQQTEFQSKLAMENILHNNQFVDKISGRNQLKFQLIMLQKNHPFIENYGINFHLQELLDNDANPANPISYPEFFINIHFCEIILDRIDIAENFKLYNDNLYLDLILSGNKNLTQSTKLNFTFSKNDEIKQLNAFDIWTMPDYSTSRFKIINQNSDKAPRKYTADFILSTKLNHSILIDIKFYSRIFKNYNYYIQNYSLNESTYALTSEEILYKKSDGITQGIQTNVIYQFSKQLQMKVILEFQNYLSDDQNYIDVWNQIPKQTLNYNIQYEPIETLSLWANFRHTSSTKWMEFYNITGEEIYSTYNKNHYYNYKIRPINQLDIKLRKTFMNNRFAANLFIQNLLDKKIRQYPGGASFDMSMYFGIDFNF